MGAEEEEDEEEVKMSWKGVHVVSVHDFTKGMLEDLFVAANRCKVAVVGADDEDVSILSSCKHKVLGLVFYEPSTRTNCSFAAAMQRLGGTCLNVTAEASSVRKGESLADTMRVMECYTDIMVLRHPGNGEVQKVSSFLSKPLINAGDGAGEHPTQALLDLYTILTEQGGQIDGLAITILGDLKYGRTTHSLAMLLGMFQVKIQYVAPEGLEMPEEVKENVTAQGNVISQTMHHDLSEVISEVDVLYVTRIQKERFESPELYEKVKDSFFIDHKALAPAKETMIVMHPLPRLNEIAEEVDSYPSAAYFRQCQNGLYVRMALIGKILGVF